MTNADRPGFAVALRRLTAVFGGQLDDVQVEEYFRALYEYAEEDEVQAAVGEANKRLKFLPKPVELIELIQERRRAAAAAAERERQGRRMLEAAPPSEAQIAENRARIREVLAALEKRWPSSRAAATAERMDAPGPTDGVNGQDATARFAEKRRRELERFTEHTRTSQSPGGDAR